MRGGANHVRIRLPHPDGTVRLAVAGGASHVRFDRPTGVPVALRVRGGVSRLRFDDRQMKASPGELELRSDDYGRAADRYEISFGGGASDLEIAAG